MKPKSNIRLRPHCESRKRRLVRCGKMIERLELLRRRVASEYERDLQLTLKRDEWRELLSDGQSEDKDKADA